MDEIRPISSQRNYNSLEEMSDDLAPGSIRKVKSVTPGPGGVNDRNKSTANIPTVNNPGPQPKPSEINFDQ